MSNIAHIGMGVAKLASDMDALGSLLDVMVVQAQAVSQRAQMLLDDDAASTATLRLPRKAEAIAQFFGQMITQHTMASIELSELLADYQEVAAA